MLKAERVTDTARRLRGCGVLWVRDLVEDVSRRSSPDYFGLNAFASGGTATVAFTVDRSGGVLSARLARSSGDAALDAEAVALARRVSPIPAPPANVGNGGNILLAVLVRFGE